MPRKNTSGQPGQHVGDLLEPRRRDLDLDDRVGLVADLEGIGPGPALHDAVPGQALDAVPDRGLRDPEASRDVGVRTPRVCLQHPDDFHIRVVQRARDSSCEHRCSSIFVVPARMVKAGV